MAHTKGWHNFVCLLVKDYIISKNMEGNMSTTAATAIEQTKDRVFISPLAKRMAERAGVDINLIPGTGPNGRIVLSDVEKYIAGTKAVSSVPVSANAGAFSSKVSAPVASSSVIVTASNVIVEDQITSTISEVIPVVSAKASAEVNKMDWHSYLTVNCEIDEAIKLCAGINEVRNVKVSVGDCAVKAAALALKQVLAAHAKIMACNVGVAISTDTGFISPVVKQADNKTLMQIKSDIDDLATKTVNGRLRSDEIEGAAIVIHKTDKRGVTCCDVPVGAANAPVLSINAGEKKVVAKNDKPEIATVMTCSLSINAITMNKDVGAEVLIAFKKFIERPYLLIV